MINYQQISAHRMSQKTNSKNCSCFLLMIILLTNVLITYAQNANDDSYYKKVKTYINPVLPGDHPDPTLLKVGNDFYHCGSSFHFTPYLPIYHSTDLVHWQVISRVVYPSNAAFVTDRP